MTHELNMDTPLEELRDDARRRLLRGQSLTFEQTVRLNINALYLTFIWSKILKIEKMLETAKAEGRL